ncbi:MAG: hypothetical protein KJ607_06560 [Bacteroidetes bacterium]|nr:hypothetical protein [Bacteroidota bacterium]
MNDMKNINDENDYIIIPNPIYDVVFRYLMDDAESAMIILSTLINEKIIKLHLEPLTHSEKKKKSEDFSIEDPKTQDDIRLFHLDFTATVELPDGTEELIMIEIQKASEPDDIFRFKRYISKNFQKKQEREIIHPESQAVKTVNKPIRLIPIFILNFRIENEINDLLIKTDRIKTGIFKNKSLQRHNEFIDNLSYDIWVVQLPNLHNISQEEYESDEYKSKLYALLKLFDQKSKVKDNEHRLRLIRKFFPGFLDRVVKRLQSASIDNPLLEEQMYAEDEYLQALIDRDNQISYFMEQLEKKGKALDEKDKALSEKDKALSEKDKALHNKDNVILHLAKLLKENGISPDEIHKKTKLPLDDINKL